MKAMDLMDALGNVPLDLIPDGADASAEAKPVQQDAVPQAEIPKITQHDNPQMHNRPKAATSSGSVPKFRFYPNCVPNPGQKTLPAISGER